METGRKKETDTTGHMQVSAGHCMYIYKYAAMNSHRVPIIILSTGIEERRKNE